MNTKYRSYECQKKNMTQIFVKLSHLTSLMSITTVIRIAAFLIKFSSTYQESSKYQQDYRKMAKCFHNDDCITLTTRLRPNIYNQEMQMVVHIQQLMSVDPSRFLIQLYNNQKDELETSYKICKEDGSIPYKDNNIKKKFII